MRLRTPALRPLMPAPAVAIAADPSAQVEAHFRAVWASSMHDMPFVNPALAVEAVGFRRFAGDWLGVVITPWFINLFLLPGGGRLWQDLPTGEHRQLALPAGTMEFIADHPGAGQGLPAYQYCPLLAPVQHIPDQDLARQIAAGVLAAVMSPPPEVAEGAAGDARTAGEAGNATPGRRPLPSAGRRAFLGGGVSRSR